MDSRLKYPLVCFDVDGTLVDDTIFIWKTLHDHFATDPALRQKAHDDFFAKRITYADWFHTDLELLRAAGATLPRFREVLDMLRPMRGAREALLDLHARGHVLAIVSGSLDVVVAPLFAAIPFRHVLLNRIEFDAAGRIVFENVSFHYRGDGGNGDGDAKLGHGDILYPCRSSGRRWQYLSSDDGLGGTG